jgi:hypothetical protein
MKKQKKKQITTIPLTNTLMKDSHVHNSSDNKKKPYQGNAKPLTPQKEHSLDYESIYPMSQQFFLRLLLVLDAHRLNLTLIHLLLHKISHLSENKQFPTGKVSNLMNNNDLTSEEFIRRVSHLRVLGKFLGFLHMYPFLSGQTNVTSSTVQSPSSSQGFLLMEMANARSTTPLLPLTKSLLRARVGGWLCTGVPWVCSALQLLQFDPTFTSQNFTTVNLANHYSDAFDFLGRLNIDLIYMKKEFISSNRFVYD